MRRDRGRVIAAAVTATAAVALAGLAALVLREPSEPGITMPPAPPDAQASSSFEPETTAASEAPASSGAAESPGAADSSGAVPASPVVVPPPPPQDLSPDAPGDADDLGRDPDDYGDGDGD